MANLSRCPWCTQVTSPATNGDVHSSTPVHLSSDFAQMCLLHPRKYISLCIKWNSSFFAISGCSCTAVNCMCGRGFLACNWPRCACQRMGQFTASAPTNQRPPGSGTLCTVSQWWHTVHVQCRPFVEFVPLYMTGERLLRSAFHLRTRHAHPALRKQQVSVASKEIPRLA